MKLFENKDIAIWGVGVLQADIEAIYHLENIVAYIDNQIVESDLINVEKHQIISAEEIVNLNKENLVFILCTKDKDYAIRKLEDLGFTKDNYLLAEKLLKSKELYDNFCNFEITVYGAGNTYLYWKKDFKEYDINITRFAVTNKNTNTFDGKPVISVNELKELKGKTRIIVSSIYYKEIYGTLVDAGFQPGYEFIQLDTFLALIRMTENTRGDYRFVNHSKRNENLLIVLSGYKEFVWESVFGRLESFAPQNTDVCIVTSGKDNPTMRNLCEKNQWSYLSTDMNNVSLATNIAISLHPDAEYIIKMDEDIFVTEGTFEELLKTYNKVEAESDYEVGFVTPLIPINGYGYARVLELLNLKEAWEKRFGEIKITDCYNHHMTIHDNPDAAEFLWGKDNPSMHSIDMIQDKLRKREFSYSVCPVRYSIGLIVFTRDNWLKMKMFPVKHFENMGADEKAICKFCMMEGKAMVVSENCIVGHLSYGPQHSVMERYYHEHRNLFDTRGK